jgi:hypothetical protein
VRYMNDRGLRRKFDIDAYVKRVNGLVWWRDWVFFELVQRFISSEALEMYCNNVFVEIYNDETVYYGTIK